MEVQADPLDLDSPRDFHLRGYYNTTMIVIKPEKLSGIVPRMLELTSRLTRWHRRNWRAGTLELVEETLSESLIPGTQSQALKEMRSHLLRALGADPAITPEQKRISECMEAISPLNGERSFEAQLAARLCKSIEESYIQQWASIFDDAAAAGAVDVEGSAKRIVSHLLYLGLPAASIYSVLQEQHNSAEEHSFSEVLRELDRRVKVEPKKFTFAIPVDKDPSFLHIRPFPPGWLNAKELREWKERYAPNAPTLRHHGGFLLTVEARDVNEAADHVRVLLPQLAFKFESDVKGGFSVLQIMWSQERGRHFRTRRYPEAFKLHAFRRADMLATLEMDPDVRNMLAIVEPLRSTTSHVEVVNGWVAIESLLVAPEEPDRVGADRMASIIAAAYFRTEMTWLAGNYVKKYGSDSPLANDIQNAEGSLQRSQLMSQAILAGCDVAKSDYPDQIAVAKMQDALANQKSVFERTQAILAREFSRMYRKRNLIVHSGRVLEHGIDSLSTNVRPLLMAGIDQILIAKLQHNVGPQELAAMIEYKVRNLPRNAGYSGLALWNLLEPDAEV